MDFLKFNEIKSEDNLELRKLANVQYLDELNNYCNFDGSLFTETNLNFQSNEINKLIISVIVDEIYNVDLIINKTSLNLLQYNPLRFDNIVCYKLIMCSDRYSFLWHIPYICLYNYYSDLTNLNKTIDIDKFIGKIRKLWDEDNDKQFQTFEKLITLKYKKIKAR